MTNPWEADDCAHLKAHYTVYSIPKAAALWCSVPEDQVEDIVEGATTLTDFGLGLSIWKHPLVPCMEPRSRAIAEAVDRGELPHGWEDGETYAEDEFVHYERRHVMGRDLREWMVKAFPNDKPAFLFDDIEQSADTEISAEADGALKAENEKLATRLENAEVECQRLRDETKEACDALAVQTARLDVPGVRAEATYRNIIAALLEVIAGKLPNAEAHPSFPSEAKLIDAIAQHYEGYPGLSKSNLERKFPEAKRALES